MKRKTVWTLCLATALLLSLAPLAENEAYLRTKRDRLGHTIVLDEQGEIRKRASA